MLGSGPQVLVQAGTKTATFSHSEERILVSDQSDHVARRGDKRVLGRSPVLEFVCFLVDAGFQEDLLL